MEEEEEEARRARRTGYGSGSTGVVLGQRLLRALQVLSRRRLRSKGEVACHHGAGEALRRTRAVVITILTVRAASSTLAAVAEATGMVVVCRLGQGGWADYPAAQG